MMISTRGRYALRVMLELALNNDGRYTPLRKISEDQGISEKYLESITKMLVNDGMIVGLRGKGGGYKLAGAPSDYTVGSILKLTEGTLAPVACLKGEHDKCPRAADCLTLPMWTKVYGIIDNYFENITLEDLINRSV